MIKITKKLRNYFKKDKAKIISIEYYLENIVKNLLDKPIEEFDKYEESIYHLFSRYPDNIYGYIGMATNSLVLGAYPAAIYYIENALKKDKANKDAITIKTEIMYSTLIANPNIITLNLLKDHKNPVDYVNDFIKEALEVHPNNKIINQINKKFQTRYGKFYPKNNSLKILQFNRR